MLEKLLIFQEGTFWAWKKKPLLFREMEFPFIFQDGTCKAEKSNISYISGNGIF